MTTFTSSIAEIAVRSVALLLCPLVIACGDAGRETAERPPLPASQETTPIAVAGAAKTGAPAQQAVVPLDAYTRDFATAVTGRKRTPPPPAGNSGMDCEPERISAGARDLTLELPTERSARDHVLAVVTPERGLLQIYTPYENDVAEEEDLLLPSDVIKWSLARDQSRFAVDAASLTGLRRGAEEPEALFIEKGRYRFALVNSISPELHTTNGTRVKVFAACSFDWTP